MKSVKHIGGEEKVRKALTNETGQVRQEIMDVVYQRLFHFARLKNDQSLKGAFVARMPLYGVLKEMRIDESLTKLAFRLSLGLESNQDILKTSLKRAIELKVLDNTDKDIARTMELELCSNWNFECKVN